LDQIAGNIEILLCYKFDSSITYRQLDHLMKLKNKNKTAATEQLIKG